MEFQSTPSARRATDHAGQAADEVIISIHALREEGDPPDRHRSASVSRISIHALREEGDLIALRCCKRWRNFNPRPPRGGRRWGGTRRNASPDFNPRPPRGGRPVTDMALIWRSRFQSTPSARRATPWRPVVVGPCDYFNPRPPRGGRLLVIVLISTGTGYFNPRPPRGGRRRILSTFPP